MNRAPGDNRTEPFYPKIRRHRRGWRPVEHLRTGVAARQVFMPGLTPVVSGRGRRWRRTRHPGESLPAAREQA